MRVLLDAHMVGERETGNETYIAGLLRGLAQVETSAEIVVAASHIDAVGEHVKSAGHVTVVPVSASPARRLGLELPRLIARMRPDVLCVTYAAPVVIGCPCVLVVHDVSFARHPEWFSPRDRLVLRLGVGISIRRATAVLTVSEFSRKEIAEAYPVAAGRIHAVLQAASPAFSPVGQNDAEVLARHGIGRPYVLAVGNLQPRKNLVRLVEAFARVAARAEVVRDLILVGKVQWGGSAARARAGALGMTDRVRAIGYVPVEDLPAIYRGADLFAYPSLYEGFGLPILESMACGTPVLTSNVASIPEVAGSAALLVDPWSVESIADGLEQMCRAEQRPVWRQRGLERAASFSLEQAARQTLDVFRRATNGGRT